MSQANTSSHQPAPVQPRPTRERSDRPHHRTSQVGAPTAPSPALVREGSKRKPTGLLVPEGTSHTGNTIAAQSAAAQVGVPAPSRRASNITPSVPATPQHPYANPSTALDYQNKGQNGTNDESVGGYRTSVAPGATPAMNAAVRNGAPPTAPQQEQRELPEPPKKGFLDFLLCRCG